MIDKITPYVKELSSHIDLSFQSNANLRENCRIKQLVYETCHHKNHLRKCKI